jgi:hypothetical protein
MTSGGHGRTELLIEGGIIAILRLERAGDLLPVAEAIRAGAAAVGVDDETVPGDALARRDFAEIARRTGAFAEAVQRARGIAARPSQPVRPIEGPDIR